MQETDRNDYMYKSPTNPIMAEHLISDWSKFGTLSW
jgi:hypothetical protein